MANSSQTSKERTEQEVLLAIEQALNLRDFDQAPSEAEDRRPPNLSHLPGR